MHDCTSEKMTGSGRYYPLPGDVQEINNWERAVNILLENADIDCGRIQF